MSRRRAHATRRKRDVLMPVLARERLGGRRERRDDVPLGRHPDGRVAEPWPSGCSTRGVLVSPGTFFGPSGEGYIRFALVPTLEECERAAPSSRRSFDDRGDDRRARPRRAPRRREGRRRVARQRGREGGDPRLLPHPQDGDDRARPVRVPRQDPAEARLRGARRARRAAGDGALRRLPRRAAS